jgi:hypothetical protein
MVEKESTAPPIHRTPRSLSVMARIVPRPGPARDQVRLIIRARMEAERLNALADKLKDLKARSAELRRYL